MRSPLVLLSVVLFLSTSTHSVKAQGASRCLGTDNVGAILHVKLQQHLSGSEQAYVDVRASAGLPTVSASGVQFVTDSASCHQVTQAFDSIMVAQFGATSQPGPAYVISDGTRYYVCDHRVRAGEWHRCMVLSDELEYLSMLGL
jgi:hypothetical protein